MAMVAVVAGVVVAVAAVATVVVARANVTAGTPSAASPPAGSPANPNDRNVSGSETASAAAPFPAQESTADPVSGLPTEIVRVVAVDAAGRATTGFTVSSDDAEQVSGCDASPSAIGAGVYRCGPTAAGADVCWSMPDGISLLCGDGPWSGNLRKVTADEALAPLTPTVDPLPWGLELSDGSRCQVRSGGAWGGRADELAGAYSCEGPSPFVLASGAAVIDTTDAVWTVRVGDLGDPRQEFPPPVETAVTKAFFADRADDTSDTPEADRLQGVEVDPTAYRQHSWSEGQPLMTSPGMDGVYFTSPSGNIRCAMRSTDPETPVICYIKEKDFESPPKPADCSESMAWATAFVTLGPAGAQNGICTGDSPVPQSSIVLPYGSLLTFAGYTCVSAQTGVECADSAGAHRFTLSRAAFVGR